MVMSWIFSGIIVIAIGCAVITGNAGPLSAAVAQGAQAGITLAISIGGSLCLWSGVGTLLERTGVTELLARFLAPLLHRVFPGTKQDSQLSQDVSCNICANFLGLGNAATPMGIRAVKRMAAGAPTGIATNEMCRLIVLNTASIQLIPANVAAVRAALGCQSPFDILPAVWLSSILSAGLGVACACLLGRAWPRD